MTKIGSISLDTLKNVCVTNGFKDVICNTCDSCNIMCFTLFMATSIHSIQKVAKIRNSEEKWKVAQKIQLFKSQKAKEKKRKGVQKK